MANLISSLRRFLFVSVLWSASCDAHVEPPPSGVAAFTSSWSRESVVFVRMKAGTTYRSVSGNAPELLPIRAQALNDYWFVDETGTLRLSPDATVDLPYTSFLGASVSAPVAYVGGPYFRDRFGQAWVLDPFKKSVVAPVPELRDITACARSVCITRGTVVYLGPGYAPSLSQNRVDWHYGGAKEVVDGYALRADGYYEYGSQVLTEDGAVWTIARDANVARVQGLPAGEHLAAGMLFERDGSAWGWGIGRSQMYQPYGKVKSEASCSFEPGPKGATSVPCAAPERLPSLDGLRVLVTSRFIFTIDRNGVAGCTGYSPYDGDVPVCPPLP